MESVIEFLFTIVLNGIGAGLRYIILGMKKPFKEYFYSDIFINATVASFAILLIIIALLSISGAFE